MQIQEGLTTKGALFRTLCLLCKALMEYNLKHHYLTKHREVMWKKKVEVLQRGVFYKAKDDCWCYSMCERDLIAKAEHWWPKDSFGKAACCKLWICPPRIIGLFNSISAAIEWLWSLHWNKEKWRKEMLISRVFFLLLFCLSLEIQTLSCHADLVVHPFRGFSEVRVEVKSHNGCSDDQEWVRERVDLETTVQHFPVVYSHNIC